MNVMHNATDVDAALRAQFERNPASDGRLDHRGVGRCSVPLAMRAQRCIRRGVALLAVVLGLVAPTAALAHGGYQMMAVTKGAYSVTVRARPFMDGKQSKIDVTSYVVRQDIGESDLNAKVQLQLAGPHGTINVTPPVVGDGYEAIIDDPQNEWRHWTITAHVTGQAGTTTVSAPPVGDPPGAPTWLIPASVVVIVIAGGLVVVGRRRRAANPESDDDADEDWVELPT